MAIALDVKSSATGSGATLSWSHTCTGSNLALVVDVGSWDGTSGNRVSGVTYNGVALTRLAEVTGASFDNSSLWGLKNPATGANTITVTFVGSPGSSIGGGQSFTGVDQTTPFGTGVTASGASGQPTVNVTGTTTGNIVVDSWAEGAGNILTATGTLHHALAISGESGGSQRKSAGGTITMNWTGATSSWSISACEVNAAGGAVASDAPSVSPLLLRLHSTKINAASIFHPLNPPDVSAFSTTTLTPAVASLVLTGATPSTVVGTVLTPAIGTLVLTGASPSTVVGTVLSPAVATMTLAGATPSTVVGTQLTPAIATLVLTGATPTTVLGTVVAPAVSTLTLSGATPSTVLGTVVAPAVASMTLSGATSSVILGTVLTPAVAPMTLTGLIPTPNVGTSLAPAPATLTLSGATSTVTATANVLVSPAPATLTLSGATSIPLVTNTTIGGIGAGGGPPAKVWTRVTRTRTGVTSVERLLPTTTTVVTSPARLHLRGMRPELILTGHRILEPRPAALRLNGVPPRLVVVDWAQEREDERTLLGIIDPGA